MDAPPPAARDQRPAVLLGTAAPARAVPPIALPLRLHAQAVEELLERLPPVVEAPRFDARHVRAAEPGAFLMLTLLAAWHGVDPPRLPVPPDAVVPPLRVADALDVFGLIEAISGAQFFDRLARLGWRPLDARALSSILRELARNAVEHAGAPAWVAGWRTRDGELRLAVADAGVGMSGSLGLRDERDALMQVLLDGRSRWVQPGRGQGLKRVSEMVARLGGRMRVRSRTVVVEGGAPWQDVSVQTQLPLLPGLQVEVLVPSPRNRRSTFSSPETPAG
ncbi:MAG TPA: ATP-binding protein [Longimicrobium sp.]|nr:ATP-binding protein [Longimicrobium sp.]